MATPMINAESAEKLLKDAVYKNWKEIQKQCRNCDKSNTGTIPVDNILGNLTVFCNISILLGKKNERLH